MKWSIAVSAAILVLVGLFGGAAFPILLVMIAFAELTNMADGQ